MRALALATLAVAVLVGCQTGATIGATCARSSDCASGTCEFGRCRAGCHANRDCPSGASCLLDASGNGACGLDVDLGCESGVGQVCPSGLVCVADRCERSCTMPSECPMDGECRAASSGGAMFCFDARAGVDAGASDASADAGAGDAGPQSCPITSVCFQRMGAACALDCMGRVWCWGQEHGGRLGNGHTDDVAVPTPGLVIDEASNALIDVDSLACGDGLACVHVGAGGSVHARHVLCWGYDAAGSFDASAHDAATELFTPIVGDSVELSASGAHVCALDHASASVVCFGRNDALIDPTMPNSALFGTPTAPVGGLAGVAEIGVAAFGGCARLQSGEVRCWGENDYGQAGHTPIEERAGAAEPPLGVTVIEASAGVPLANVEQLAVGFTERAVLAQAGASGPLTLFTWGGNQDAQLGERTGWVGEACDDVLALDPVCRARPATPIAAPMFTTIATEGSAWTTCGVVASSQHVLCWGDNLFAHGGVPGGGGNWIAEGKEVLLDGTTDVPLSDVVDVFVGAGNACAIRSDGTLWCWGPNQDAQLARPLDALEHLALPITIPFP